MRITTTPIGGLYVIEGLRFPDNRGELLKPFAETFFAEMPGLNIEIKETWFTKSHKDVIRGMHMQLGEHASEKLVSVINGHLIDVILDAREASPTYGQVFDIELSGTVPRTLYIPIGCAHGYKVLEDNTITMYMATQNHDAKGDTGVNWKSINYDWGLENPVVSQKDIELPPFKK